MAFPFLLGGAPSRYRINQSLRFRASNSATLTRTPASTTNRRTFTFAFWIKRGTLGGTQLIFNASSGTSGDSNWFGFNWGGTGNSLVVTTWATNMRTTTRDFRDPSAWYHIVVAVDTTQATAANRVRVYVNGVEETSFSTNNNVAQNTDLAVNDSAAGHRWGRRNDAAIEFFDGYLAEAHFIDGQQLTPASFGQFDLSTNSWVPRRYTGTYGTNGFYLPFNDAASTTTISQDRSGNGNNWTSSGISVTAGATFDQMLDTPTNNFATLNPIVDATAFGAAPGISAANLNSTGQNTGTIIPTFAMTTGRWYMEVVPTFSGGNHYFGVRRLSTPPTGNPWNEMIATMQTGGWMDGAGNFTASGGAAFSSGQTLGLTWDADAGTFTVRVNNTLAFTHTVAGWAGAPVVFAFSPSLPSGASQVWNFGQRPFAYTPPTGFVALNTANLATPTIPRGDVAFDVALWAGNSAARTITLANSQLTPGLIWIKSRTFARNHILQDSARGFTTGRKLSSHLTDQEGASVNLNDSFGYVSGVAPGSFSLDKNGSGSDWAQVNVTGDNYVGWTWHEGAAYGFDIAAYTGTGSTRTVAHGLNAVPHMMIVKDRSNGTGHWAVYHRNANASPQNGGLYLSLTQAFDTTANFWSNTAPTSSVFTTSASHILTNQNGVNYVAYLWTSIPGFSLFGSYTGNGSSDGPFVWCGFRPRFVLVKGATIVSSWYIWDTARNTFNVMNSALFPNLADAETTVTGFDATANGFKVRQASGSGINDNGQTYIFAAFAETPFKFANAR